MTTKTYILIRKDFSNPEKMVIPYEESGKKIRKVLESELNGERVIIDKNPNANYNGYVAVYNLKKGITAVTYEDSKMYDDIFTLTGEEKIIDKVAKIISNKLEGRVKQFCKK